MCPQVGVVVQLVTNGIKVGEYRPDRSDDAVDNPGALSH